MIVRRPRVFYSFHYSVDNWRASQIRNIGAIEGNTPVSDNVWEQVACRGDLAIARWILREMAGRSCTVVLIGSRTAGRKWINFEIEQSWKSGKGLLGIYIDRLKNRLGLLSVKGRNPFATFRIGRTPLSMIVRAYDPPFLTSTGAYRYIAANLKKWVEQAITIRRQYS